MPDRNCVVDNKSSFLHKILKNSFYKKLYYLTEKKITYLSHTHAIYGEKNSISVFYGNRRKFMKNVLFGWYFLFNIPRTTDQAQF